MNVNNQNVISNTKSVDIDPVSLTQDKLHGSWIGVQDDKWEGEDDKCGSFPLCHPRLDLGSLPQVTNENGIDPTSKAGMANKEVIKKIHHIISATNNCFIPFERGPLTHGSQIDVWNDKSEEIIEFIVNRFHHKVIVQGE